MTRSLTLAVAVAAALALPALAEEVAPDAAKTEAAPAAAAATGSDTAKPIKMYRTLGQKSCSPFMRHRRIVWGRAPQQSQQQ